MAQDKISQLKQLSELYKAGILTKEEVEQEKNKILGKVQLTNINEKELHAQNNDNKEISRPNNNDKDEVKPSRSSLSSPAYEDYDNKEDEIKGARKKKLIYGGITLLILIGIGVFIGLYQHHQNQIALAKEREQARLDSIAEVERLLEIHRQDSIRHFNEIKNFTSPDLKFFNLKGKVRRVINKYDYDVLPNPLYYEILDFSKDGACLNIKKIGAELIHTEESSIVIKRNSEGYIIRIYEKGFEDTDYNTCSFNWQHNKLLSYNGQSSWWFVTTSLSYNDNFIYSEDINEDVEGFYSRRIIYLYKNHKLDIYGNWIECEYEKDISQYYGKPQTNSKGIIKREIEYYD